MKVKKESKMLKEKLVTQSKVNNSLDSANSEEINDNEQFLIESKKAVKRKIKKESGFQEKENLLSDEDEPMSKLRKPLDTDDSNKTHESNGLKDVTENALDVDYWKKFIKSLKEDKAVEAVQFLLLDIKGRDVVAEFLEMGGSALRVIEVLDRADKKSTSLACTVFSVVRLIILKCMSKYPLLEVSTEQSCKHILHTYAAMLHEMLTASTTFREKKIVLSLLAAMATMNLNLANEVLVIFNALTSKHVDKLSAHSTFGEDKSVRIYYLHLLLAFFSHGRTHLIKMLLSLKNIMRSVSRGLMQDDATTVVLILTAVHDNIVDSDLIVKTLKIHTFNTPVLQDIISLYKWQGSKSKKRKVDTEDCDDDEIVLPQAVLKQQETVQGSVHRLLIKLLTNHKLGIIFQDPSVGTSGKRCNELAYSVLKIMQKEKYWKCDLVRELTAKTLEACPDLVSPVLNLLVGSFEPIPSGSWLKTVQFLQEVVNNVKDEVCLSTILNTKQLSHVVTSMVFSSPVCSVLSTEDCLNHPHPSVRLQGVTTLLCCFRKVVNLTSVVRQRYIDRPQDLENFQKHITNFITKNIKAIPLLVKALQSGLEGEIYGVHAPTDVVYYTALVDLFLVYYELYPFSPDPDLLNTLANLKTVENELLSISLTKLVFLLNPSQSTFVTEFEEMIETLVRQLATHPMAGSVLQDILSSSNLFNGSECEVSIWMHCLEAEAGNITVAKLFLDSLNKTVSNAVEIAQALSDANEVNTEAGSRGELNWDELVKLTKDLAPEQNHMTRRLSVSPLVPAVLFALEATEYSKKDIKDFVINLFFHLLHTQINPEAFYRLIKDCNLKLLKSIKKYVFEWTTDCSVEGILSRSLSVLRSGCSEYEICTALYSQTPISFDAISADSAVLLLRLVIFHVSQLADKHCATDIIVQNAASLVHDLLLLLSAGCEKYIPHVQYILQHPALLENFNPLNDGRANNLTPIVLIVIKSGVLKNKSENFMATYRHRMIEKVKQALIENEGEIVSDKIDKLIKALELLRIPAEEAQLILENILALKDDKNKQLWLDVAELMLITVSKSHLSLSPDVVKQLTLHRRLHRAAALYLTAFPHHMSIIDTDLLVAKQKELTELTELMLQFDNKSVMLTKLLNNNKRNPKVVFPALAAARCPPRYEAINHHGNDIQEALKSNPHPSWLVRHSAFIGTLLKNINNDEWHKKLRDYFLQEWQTLEVADTLLDIAEPVFAKTKEQTTLVLKLIPALEIATTLENLNCCERLCNRIQKYVQSYPNCNWSLISESDEWKKWCTLALKYGEDPNINAAFLLTTLSSLCSPDSSHLDTLLERVFSHSQFLNAMIWKTQTKYELLRLILKLVTLKPSLMHSNHVPLYLSAYNASLGDSDLIIIQLLQLYEKNGIGLSNWKPFFWGEAAVGFYSLRNKGTPSLLNAAKSNQVFSLFSQRMVESTIASFPYDRNLEAEARTESDKDIYDPAFFLPLLSELLASNEVIKIRNVTESGALAITICALSSCHKLVRSAAYLVIARFHHHLASENTDSLCLQFVEALCKGVCGIKEQVPQLPTIITTFLARTQLVLTDSSHPMYKALGRFIIVKPELNFVHIPEWNRLFEALNLKISKIHQEWMLKVLRDGIRQGKDVGLIISNNIIPVLMDYYSSLLSDKKTKLLILEVILSVFKAAHKNKSLCHTLAAQNGISSWLSHIIYTSQLKLSPLPMLISILNTVHKYLRCPLLVLNLVLHLCTKFPSTEIIVDLLRIVDSLPSSVLSSCAIDTLILASGASDMCTKHCRDILQFGTCYQKNIDEESQVSKYLKSIVIKYVKKHVEKHQPVKTVKVKSKKTTAVKKKKVHSVVKKSKT